jgi:hypothetical protein
MRIALAALLLALAACDGAPYYKILDIDAQVIDAETRAPIPGAVVVANWEMERQPIFFAEEYTYQGQLEVRETVTDGNGRFHFKGFIHLNPLMIEDLGTSDPHLVIFKAGYQYLERGGSYDGTGIVRDPAWNRRTLELQKDHDEWSVNRVYSPYLGLNSALSRLLDECYWKDIPHMMIAMSEEHQRLAAAYSPSISDSLMTIENMEAGGHCGISGGYFEKLGYKRGDKQ